LCFLEVRGGVAGKDVGLVFPEVEFPDLARGGGKIDRLEVDPERIRCQDGFEEVQFALVVSHGSPASRGDIGFVGRGNPVRHRDVTDHTEDACQRNRGIFFVLGDGIDVERGARKPVRRAIGSRQHHGAADLLPVCIQGKLLIEGRRVGHNLVFAVVVDDLLAADIFDDGAVACRIGDRQMQRRQAIQSRHLVGDDGERFAAQCVNRLPDRRKVIEDVLRPGCNREPGFDAIEGGIA